MRSKGIGISIRPSGLVGWLWFVMIAGAFFSAATAGIAIPPEASPHDRPTLRFAVIGDYGRAGRPERAVAHLVAQWHPDIILTTGDNDYPAGDATTLDQNIGQYYHAFIAPYHNQLGTGATVNRFFPALGNHDWYTAGAKPYVNYFTLPGNERYYTFSRGPVQFFALDSDSHEPDGIMSDSPQGQWLQRQLQASHACWKIAYFHHPPYSSGTTHGSSAWMQWPFRQWGVDAVLSGHEHNYERLEVDGLLYVVNGAGGSSLYPFGPPLAGSQVRYNADYGALFVEASSSRLTFQFVTQTGQVVDAYQRQKPCP
jgi:tartrate-resistant acid phosphatase type 5